VADDSDRADIAQTKMLEAGIGNRVKFTEWDGKPRDCIECDNPIHLGRLKAINAKTCVYCAE